MLCAVTLTVNKAEAKSEGKTKAGARALSWVDAEVAAGPAEPVPGQGSPRLQQSCG